MAKAAPTATTSPTVLTLQDDVAVRALEQFMLALEAASASVLQNGFPTASSSLVREETRTLFVNMSSFGTLTWTADADYHLEAVAMTSNPVYVSVNGYTTSATTTARAVYSDSALVAVTHPNVAVRDLHYFIKTGTVLTFQCASTALGWVILRRAAAAIV